MRESEPDTLIQGDTPTPTAFSPRPLDWSWTKVTSVVRQTVDNLFSFARARLTFSKMSDAFAVQMNGFGSAL